MMSQMEKRELYTRISGMTEEEQMITASALSDDVIISALASRMMKLHYLETHIGMLNEKNCFEEEKTNEQ